MKSLEKLAKELDWVLNIGGKVCNVRIISDKIELKYFDPKTQKDEKKKLTQEEAENMIISVYNEYGLKRK